jgi:hypothetical protein
MLKIERFVDQLYYAIKEELNGNAVTLLGNQHKPFVHSLCLGVTHDQRKAECRGNIKDITICCLSLRVLSSKTSPTKELGQQNYIILIASVDTRSEKAPS